MGAAARLDGPVRVEGGLLQDRTGVVEVGGRIGGGDTGVPVFTYRPVTDG